MSNEALIPNLEDAFGGSDTTGGSNRLWTDLKLKPANKGEPCESIPLRLFPAMHSLKDKNDGWIQYHAVHWGYSVPGFKDKNKPSPRPFECIEEVNFQTKMTEVSCPECRNIDRHKVMLADATAKVQEACKAQKVLDQKQIDARVKADPECAALSAWLDGVGSHNAQKAHYVNAIGLDGKFYNFQMPGKMKGALKTRIDELRKNGIEPMKIGGQGVYFVFKRQGYGGNTQHSVDVFKEQGAEVGTEKTKFAPLSQDQLKAALKSLPDMATMLTRKLSAQQIQLLVECSGAPEEVEVIMDMDKPKTVRNDAPPASRPAGTGVAAPAAAPNLPPPQMPAQAAPAAPAAPAQPAQPTQLEAMAAQMKKMQEDYAKLVASQAAPAAAPAQAAPAAPAAPAAAPTGLPEGFNPMDPAVDPATFAAMFKLPPR